MIIAFIIWYIIYIIISVFFVTTIVYFTYRFWKFILPREEHNIYVANAPVIWHNYNFKEEKINNEPIYNEPIYNGINDKKNGSNVSILFFWIVIIVVLIVVFLSII